MLRDVGPALNGHTQERIKYSECCSYIFIPQFIKTNSELPKINQSEAIFNKNRASTEFWSVHL